MSTPRGFSLLEMVMTLIIAGILAAIAIPRFADTQDQAAWFAEQVRAAVRYAQRQAVAQRRSIYVCVQSTQVNVAYDAACSPANRFSTYTLTAPGGVTITPVTTFSFNGLGQPSASIALNIGGSAVTVVAETGYVP